MFFLVGEIVVSQSCRDWGPGRIIFVSARTNYLHIYFPKVGIRKIPWNSYKENFSHILTNDKEDFVKRHNFFLKLLGTNYEKIRKTQKSIGKIVYCRLCNKILDGSTGEECAACGWIICRCGACGCICNHKIRAIDNYQQNEIKFHECLHEDLPF